MMGFPSIFFDNVTLTPWHALQELWNHLKFMATLTLFHLGLFDPTDWSSSYDHIRTPALRSPRPSQPASPVLLLPTAADIVKEELPVVSYAAVAAENDGKSELCGDGHLCIICLAGLELHQEVRKLCNCKHVFHVGCLDGWVDLGQVTCPLCRAGLLPQKEKEKDKHCRIGRDQSWVVERISYLFGEDLFGRC